MPSNGFGFTFYILRFTFYVKKCKIIPTAGIRTLKSRKAPADDVPAMLGVVSLDW